MMFPFLFKEELQESRRRKLIFKEKEKWKNERLEKKAREIFGSKIYLA